MAALSAALLFPVVPASAVAAGDVAAARDTTPKIAQVFFAQHHVLSIDNPLFTLVGNLEALIKVQVYSQTARQSPAVSAKVALGANVLDLPLKGPEVLPKPPACNPIVMEQRYEDSFTAIIPREWIKPGMKVMVELRERKGAPNGAVLDRKVLTALPVGAPTRLIMTMFDFHFFGGATGADYPNGWFEELASKLPVAELELRRVRNISLDKLVMMPRGDKPATLCSSRSEYTKKTGLKFDGEQDVAGRWNGALKEAAGAGWGGTRRLYYSNIYGVFSGGMAGGLSGRGNGTMAGILLHELGHAFGLPHWAGKTQYPYIGDMHGISSPGGSDFPHVGPTWAFDLVKRQFISPTENGHYKKDPMQGGGAGDRNPYLYKQFSDYSVSRIRGCLESTQVVWDDRAGAYVQWDPASGSYSKVARRRGPPPSPIEDDVDVISVLVSASLVTPEANIVYPPIGPYVAGRLETFDASDPGNRSRAGLAGFSDSTCNTCLRVTQGKKVTAYMIKDGLAPNDDPRKPESLAVFAVNLPARDGEVTQADLLHTPGVMSHGVSPACKVLYSWQAASAPGYKTQTVTALYPAESAAIAARNVAAAPPKPSAKVAAPEPPKPAPVKPSPPTPAEKVAAAAEPPPRDTRTAQEQAASDLKVAKLLLAAERRTTAIERLQDVVRKWPDTPAARDAKTLLQNLGQQVEE
jgi:cell division septation protein DedD